MLGSYSAVQGPLIPAMGAATPALGAQVGTGAFLGFSMGYFMKKMSKVFMFFAGMIVALAAYLELNGLLSVNWTGLAASFGTIFSWITRGIGDGSVIGFTRSMIAVVPLGGSFAAFALIGFKYG